MRESFEADFLTSLSRVPDALFIALGPTPFAALDHAVGLGLLERSRVLGALAHPSSGGGSQVDVYLGLRRPEDLKKDDPVRRRFNFLLPAAKHLRAAVAARLGGGALTRPEMYPPRPATPSVSPRTAEGLNAPTKSAASTPDGPPKGLHYIIERGANAGKVLHPHVHKDHCIVVSPTRFKKDYIRLPSGMSPEPYLARGYSLRMSAPDIAPSLISPASIRGRKTP
jgi:hypothetical protein